MIPRTVTHSSSRSSYNSRYVSLEPGVEYAFRVRAKNVQGYGYFANAEVTMPNDALQPTRPISPHVGRYYTGTSASPQFGYPQRDGGSEVTSTRLNGTHLPPFPLPNFQK